MRRLSGLVLALALIPSFAHADTTLTDVQGYTWDIDGDTYGAIVDGSDDTYDNWPGLCVMANQDQTGACSTSERYNAGGAAVTLELSGRQVVMGVHSINGLTVRRKVYVPSGGSYGWARYMEILQNAGTSPVTIKV